ncbi:unnamed protein product [Acanthoscelides obtectus]|uniref:Uncharacterized protein n=1 Tax=Acanthoscelides obtectus TaxID=200917 RepID=A0A9P0PT86_ACAOB|nr:unnamed protein product [Acanthoscelides obtectus]CAK1650245.1 hypothetical protein AOBTE_LOCUS16714 [Acanthoscelides obtectus]
MTTRRDKIFDLLKKTSSDKREPLKPLSFLNSSQVPAKNNTKSGEPEICDANVNFSQSLPEASHLKFTNAPDPHFSKEKCFSKLMMDSANIQLPSSLIPYETTTLIADTNFGSLFNSLQSNGSELFAQQKHDIEEQVNVEDHELSDQLSLRSELEDPFANSVAKIPISFPRMKTRMCKKIRLMLRVKAKQGKGKGRRVVGKEILLNLPGIVELNTKTGMEIFRIKGVSSRLVKIVERDAMRTSQKKNALQYLKLFGIYRTLIDSVIILPRREFNLSFFQPKKDLCDTCHKYDNSSVEEKAKMEEQYLLHDKNKKITRELKEKDMIWVLKKKSLCVAVYDLQQVLPVPQSNVGKFEYLKECLRCRRVYYYCRTCKHKPKVKMSLYNEKHQSRSQRMVDIAKKNKTENSNINDDVATTTDDNKKIIILKNDVIQKPHCGLVSEQVVNNQDQDEYQSIDQQPMELVRDFVSEEVVSNQDQDQYQSY